MKFHLVERANPMDVSAPKKWYANPVNDGKVTKRDFSKRIAGRSSLTAGDVTNVLENFLDEMPEYLLMGKSIALEGFGTFRLSFGSEGADSKELFSASMIKDLKVVFTPSVEFKERLSSVHFEKED